MSTEKPDRSGRFTRILTAPREFVLRMWTDAEHLAQWWGPDGFTNPVCRIDAREGGELYIEMRGPDGTVYPLKGSIREIVEPQRLAFVSAALEDGKALFETLTTVTFDEHEGVTRMTLSAKLLGRESDEATPYLEGMQQGWSQTLNRLMDYVVAKYAEVPEVVITRTINAPLAKVWSAYSDGALLPRWGGPKGMRIGVAEFSFRPGGAYRYSMETPGGLMWGKWAYRAIAAQERLVISVAFTDAEGEPVRHPMAPTWPLHMLSIATFEEHDGKTTLTMRLRPLMATEEEGRTFKAGEEGMNKGFDGSFAQLEELLDVQ